MGRSARTIKTRMLRMLLRSSGLHGRPPIACLRRCPKRYSSNSVTHPEMSEPYTFDTWLDIYARHIPDHIEQMQRAYEAWQEAVSISKAEGQMTIKKIFVVGAGTMGNGIAQAAATSGYEVTCMDVMPAALEKARPPSPSPRQASGKGQPHRRTEEAGADAIASSRTWLQQAGRPCRSKPPPRTPN